MPPRSDKAAAMRKTRLSNNEWLTVFTWMDKNSNSQSAAVRHLEELPPDRGQLIFSQPSLHRHLKRRQEIEAGVGNPSAAKQQKRTAKVAYPQVELALVNWCKGLFARAQVLTGDMIKAKFRALQVSAEVPEDQILKGSNGWLERFKKGYGIRLIKKEGEAASAPVKDVPTERQRIAKIIAKYAPEDRYNADETALFPQ
ncbi:hypothetical protein JCM10908_006294 [Rhodotorula pacifica]|uniref:uncharacterized protein n=1 Tax=Rhodotorula pacifica TaxID=1495444 RepID=UPI00317C6A3B